MKQILALDFDGVVCDSALELAHSAWKAGAAIWPHWKDKPLSNELANRFKDVRPALETGYQAIPFLRLLEEGEKEEQIRTAGNELIDKQMKISGHDRGELKKLLSTARNAWIESDFSDWLGVHEFYPGIIEAIKEEIQRDTTVYIITTKQESFTQRLLESQGLQIPHDRIYGLDSLEKLSGKPGVLEILIHTHPEASIAFVEDRLETLQTVISHPNLQQVHTYLVDWGYNTAKIRETAMQMSRIEVIGLSEFPPRP